MEAIEGDGGKDGTVRPWFQLPENLFLNLNGTIKVDFWGHGEVVLD